MQHFSTADLAVDASQRPESPAFVALSGDSDFCEGSQCRWGKKQRRKKKRTRVRKNKSKKERKTRRTEIQKKTSNTTMKTKTETKTSHMTPKLDAVDNRGKTGQVRLSMGGGQLATHNSRVGLTTRWQLSPKRKSGQIVQNVELTYAGETRRFAERFPVSTKSKYDSLTISVEALESPGGYTMEAVAWYVPAANVGDYIKSMPVKGTIGKQWWGNTFGRKGHLDVPAFATYHRSFQMVWDGGGAQPRVVKRKGF